MIKAIIVSAVLFAIPAIGAANCGDNGKDVGNGCNGDTGNSGRGQPGQPGKPGLPGQPGGVGGQGGQGGQGGVGLNGKDASASFRGTDLAGDFAVRLLDTKYVQLQAFDQYVFGSTPGSDIFGDGRNSTIGARIVFKIGKSYEERVLEKQALELKALEARLSLLGVK